MAEKMSGLKKLFSKSNKDCCSVEIEEVKADENDDCCDETGKKRKKQQKEA
ncbi:hypothetical protein [Bacillus piscicola]|uniref:hypothetical protein n=1 Tax=Bacillus piscicola TaxID=1632684 RepID=UPI001F08CD16|nr:hypothetical protein [Bacillus piscicola]